MTLETISEEQKTALTSQGYTDDDLRMLAPSEVESLLAAQASGSSGADPHETAINDQDDAGTGTGNVATQAANTETVNQEEVADSGAAQFIPQYSAEVPSDAKQQMDALRQQERDAFKKLMDGEIDADDYQKERDRVDAAVDALKTAQLKAEIFASANAQAAEQVAKNEWLRAESAAMQSFKEEGLDYKGKPALLAAYNVNLKALGNDPKNDRKDAAWFLAEAHRLTKADLGITTSVKKDVTNDSPGIDTANLPPTLRSVPASANGAVNGDEFAHMRNLDGLALERAHAALTDAQRDRWMSQ